MERVPADKREEWLHQLNAPLPSPQGKVVEKRGASQAELEQDADLFMAFMGQHSKNTGG